jgi:hypothetical protein
MFSVVGVFVEMKEADSIAQRKPVYESQAPEAQLVAFDLLPAGERRVKGEEVRDAVGAEDHGLAVDDGRAAGKASERLGDAGHAARVITPASGEDAGSAVFEYGNGAVSVLDLVHPCIAAG